MAAASAGAGVEKLNSCARLVGMWNGVSAVESSMVVPQNNDDNNNNSNTELPYDPAIPLLGTYSK